jgi:8-oxo-dGTP pyrophosphatase MutT (NUDIX family)
MQFESFLSLISKVKNVKTGGLNSQLKMAPAERKILSDLNISSRNPKKAAVLALFYPNKNNETCFSLILRPSYKGIHAGQISFPGGKFEKLDVSLKNTALRETYEEIGVESSDIQIKKQLTNTFIPPSNYLVSPFIGVILYTPTFQYNHEVDEVIEVKLLDLLKEETITSKKLSTSYMNNINVPYYKLNGYTVWGATAMMLSEIKDLLKSL